MALEKEVPTDLTLDLGDDLGPEDFMSAVKHFFGYVQDIAQSQEGDGSQIHWIVRVKEGSSLIGVEPDQDASVSRLAMVYEKAKFAPSAVARGDFKGAGISDKAISHLKALSEIAVRTKDGNGINIWVKRSPVQIDTGIAKYAREDWDSDYFDFGTIEGRLEAIHDSAGGIKIRIKDFLYPRAITCVVDEKMINQVLSSFRKRVEVNGRIHFRRDGSPMSIKADRIEVLPEDDELPSVSDVRGIMAPA